MSRKSDRGSELDAAVRQSPVHIPLDFETAMEGLLRVKPPKKAAAEKPPAPKAGAKKKPAAKKAARKKKS